MLLLHFNSNVLIVCSFHTKKLTANKVGVLEVKNSGH
jgi:hypothetical protein